MTITRYFLGILLLIHVLPIITLYNHFLSEVQGSDDFYQTTDHRRRPRPIHHDDDDYPIRKLESFRASLSSAAPHKGSLISTSAPPSPPVGGGSNTREYHVTSYGADPTGKSDSTEALLKAFADASKSVTNDTLIAGISNVGGAQIHLDGGIYLVTHPLRFPTSVGNILVHGGTLKASDTFPTDGYLIELSTSSPPPSTHQTKEEKAKHDRAAATRANLVSSTYIYEYITFRDLLLDCNYRGGGIAVVNSLRTAVDNVYVTHFATDGILVRSGHETSIRNSYLGQHITAGSDPGERSFSGTAVALLGNDNIVSNVVVFSAATGVLVSGQANLISGVHCYNKATGFGGVGIYLRLPGLTQTRILGSYMDYTGIVAEDPVQLVVAGNFFLGDAALTIKSVKGVVNGLAVVDNIFSGSGSGVDIVKLDGEFAEVQQVVVERNSVNGMNLKATSARAHVQGDREGPTWTADFNGVLLFPDMIRHVQFSTLLDVAVNGSAGSNFLQRVNLVLRDVSENKVVIQSSENVELGNSTSVYVMVDQGF
ncbi:hypothetical protein V2J09_016175 [Rumex salicifolius]